MSCYTHHEWSAIVFILLSVCLSVCDEVYCVAQGRCIGGWKLYRCMPTRALPIHLFIHCCRMYRLATRDRQRISALGEKPDRKHRDWIERKQTSVWNCKYVTTHADHGYSRQRAAACSYKVDCIVRSAVRSAITATAEINCYISL